MTSLDWIDDLLADGGHEASLLLAPPGCGKTEELASFCRSVIEAGLLDQGEHVLALTFSKKARANLRQRIARHLGPVAQQRVEVRNFHALAFALARQHWDLLGLGRPPDGPRLGWLDDLSHELATDHGVSYWDVRDLLQDARLTAKRTMASEYEILELMEAHSPVAGDYQRRLADAREVDFDDVMRLGCRAVQIPSVHDILRLRYPYLLVDEVQDLTVEQYEMAASVGDRRRVFAGDIHQAIYGWAGAQPEAVLKRIGALPAAPVDLVTSWRSSPEVLRAVSAVSEALGGPTVEAAEPLKWESQFFDILAFDDVDEEAEAILDLASEWLWAASDSSVAVIARSNARLGAIVEAATTRSMPVELWDEPAFSPEVARLLRTSLARVDSKTSSVVNDLRHTALLSVDPLDFETADELDRALRRLDERALDYAALHGELASMRVASTETAPVGPGLHVLSSHKGKGQQFDRVLVVGLEEEILPCYPALSKGTEAAVIEELRTFLVMLSRAREGVLVTRARLVPNARGAPRAREPSRFLAILPEPT